MRQGEVRPYLRGSARLRVVVVSGDAFNVRSAPLIAPIYRLPDLPPVLVGLHDSDPLGGAVDLRELGAIPADALGEPIGMITGHTMVRVRAAVADILES